MKRMEVREGDMLPKWYGRAYRDFRDHVIYCYPIPFNLFVRFGRWLRIIAWRPFKHPRSLEDANIRISAHDYLHQFADQLAKADKLLIANPGADPVLRAGDEVIQMTTELRDEVVHVLRVIAYRCLLPRRKQK